MDKVQAHVHHDPSNLNLGLGSELAGNFCCAPKMKDLKTCQSCKIQRKVHQFGVGASCIITCLLLLYAIVGFQSRISRAEVKSRFQLCQHVYISCRVKSNSAIPKWALCFNLRAVAQQYMNYIAKFQSAKMILDAAATNAKTLTVPAGTLCKTTPELAASRWGWDGNIQERIQMNPDMRCNCIATDSGFRLRCLSPNDPNRHILTLIIDMVR